MRMILGTELNAEDQQSVLRCYVHRFTGNHTPNWAQMAKNGGKPYPVQFANDADWLAHTLFPVLKSGGLSRRSNLACHSNPTWPNNPELRKGAA